LLWIAAQLLPSHFERWIERMRRRLPDHAPAGLEAGTWMAVRTAETRAVARALGLEHVTTANWQFGIASLAGSPVVGASPVSDAATEAVVFVTPPVNGWTFVIGRRVPGVVGRRFVDICTPLLQRLSSEFGAAHFYSAEESVEVYGWARAYEGRVMRAFALGDEGLVWNKGRVTPEERRLSLKLFDLRAVDEGGLDVAVGDLFAYPTARHVHRLAALWSLDPAALPADGSRRGLGLLGRAPSSWKPRRLPVMSEPEPEPESTSARA
jgi:hypothetical protein